MKLINARQIADLVTMSLVIFGLYFLSYFLVWAVITPLQNAVIPEITKYASLLFLPHGIRVFATSLVGRKSIPGLLLAEFVGNYIFWDVGGVIPLLVVSLASGTVTYVVFEALKVARVNAYYLHVTSQPPPLHTFMLAGVLASAANGFLVTTIMEGGMTTGQVTSVLAAFMTGDVTGLIGVIMIAKLMMPVITAKMQQDE